MFDLSAREGLRRLGYDLRIPCSGRVIVKNYRGQNKRYTFRHRVKDGAILTRMGELHRAWDHGNGVIVFSPEAPQFVGA